MIDLPTWSLIISIVLLLFLSGFFSASELALFSFRKTRLVMLVKQGNKKAQRLNHIMQKPESILSTILVGNNIINTASAVLATILAVRLFPEHGYLIALFGMAFLTIQFGEVLPKALASQFWEKTAFSAVNPLRVFSTLFYPFVKFFSLTTRFFAFLLGIKIKYRKPFITKDELRYTVEMAKDAGHLKDDETLILQNIFKFTDQTVADVMLPKEKVDVLNIDASQEEILTMITNKHHTRIPVYQGKPDNIIGILYTKEYLNVICHGDTGLIILHDLIRKPYVVSDTAKTSEILKVMQKSHIHLAIVKDRADKFIGVITIEDILEEIVGDIWDEHDELPDKI
ncbi:MAG: HlyC/CorC family transporter [Planctomycetes bacterium]|nr:HlyC/CorC family transporter [Planctomycetota bacterium]